MADDPLMSFVNEVSESSLLHRHNCWVLDICNVMNFCLASGGRERAASPKIERSRMYAQHTGVGSISPAQTDCPDCVSSFVQFSPE